MAARLESVRMEVVPDEHGDASWLYQDGLGFEDRRAAYERGDFGLVGVRAVAVLEIPAYGDSFVIQEIRSAGLWGIESDSSHDYFESVYAEELDELYVMLGELGVKFERVV